MKARQFLARLVTHTVLVCVVFFGPLAFASYLSAVIAP